MRQVWLFFDGHDPYQPGCGFRRIVVLEEGRKWARCLYVPGLLSFKLPVEALARSKPVTDSDPRKLARIIRNNIKERRRLALRFSETAAKAALEGLKAP